MAAVARKLVTAIWHLLSPLHSAFRLTKQLQLKLSVIAGILGKETLKDMGFEKRNDFILKQFENMKLNT